MRFRLLLTPVSAALFLAACGDSGSATQAQSGEEGPAVVEANPYEVTEAEPQAASDAPMPAPIDDKGEHLYRKGRYKEAIAHWEQAAKAGDAYANYRLGVEYLDASVVERDMGKAAAYQKRAAELGDARGMFELATLHEYGQGVERSEEKAAHYYLMAAERGLAEAQHNIAAMFETGIGVRKDLVQAYKFYGLARAQGYLAVDVPGRSNGGQQVATDPMSTLEEVMTAEQLAKARRQIAEFKPKK